MGKERAQRVRRYERPHYEPQEGEAGLKLLEEVAVVEGREVVDQLQEDGEPHPEPRTVARAHREFGEPLKARLAPLLRKLAKQGSDYAVARRLENLRLRDYLRLAKAQFTLQFQLKRHERQDRPVPEPSY